MSWDSFAEPDTEFRIEDSQTPPDDDGYWPGEPKRLVCVSCGASVRLDEDPATPGVEDLPHARDCDQRFVFSEWYVDQLED